MIQIIDISKKILYEEVKAEKDLLTIINGTVSHELRNPLFSLISQILKLDDHVEELVPVGRVDPTELHRKSAHML